MGLLLAFLASAGIQAWQDSATFDEPVYIASGVAALLQGDVAINPEHPPLFKAVSAIPVLLAHPVAPDSRLAGDEHAYSADYLRTQERAGRWAAQVRAGRVVPILETLICALLIMLLARDLLSRAAGLWAAAGWLTAPLVLGLGHLDGVDLPFAMTTLLAIWAMSRWWHERTRRRLLVVGSALGLVMAAQFSGALLLALGLVVIARRSRNWREAVAGSVTVLALSWAMLWLSYLVFAPSVLADAEWLLPRPAVAGIRYLFTVDTVATPGYLFGHLWSGGKWWYWPASLLIKTALPLTLLILLGLPLWRRITPPNRQRFIWLVASPALLLTLPLLFDPRDIGVRYLLPQFALLMIVASAATLTVGRWARSSLSALGVLAAVVGLASTPHSLAWVSEPFNPAYRNASNSSVDWGQDLYLLRRWAIGKHPYVSYFGPRGTSAADVPGATELVGVKPESISGWVAASATNLTTNRSVELAWLRKYCPVDVLGGTILIYRFDRAPDSAPGSAAPRARCPN